MNSALKTSMHVLYSAIASLGAVIDTDKNDFINSGNIYFNIGKRHYRLCIKELYIDISDLEFDRWANSRERTITYKSTSNLLKSVIDDIVRYIPLCKHKKYYSYLEITLPIVMNRLLIDKKQWAGLIVSDGDKVESLRGQLDHSNIPYYHGALMYMLTKVPPYCHQCRQTKDGWVDVIDWIIANYTTFKDLFPPA